MGYFSANGNAPENAKFFIHESFGTAWAKVIARSWLFTRENPEEAAKIENGELGNLSDDGKWYSLLLSDNSENVKQALVEEGLVSLGALEKDTEEWKQWLSSEVYVLPQGREKELTISAVSEPGEYQNSSENGWSSVKGLDHVVVLTLPQAPADDAEFAIALADYCCTGKTYVFSC